MFGINEIISKVINETPLTEKEKINILRAKRIDPKVVKYLIGMLNELHIEILGDYKGSIFELMSIGVLEGWCWQTTESAIVFFNDDDYIERGYLNFDEINPKYYHSWICFHFNGMEYVFDPCLNFLCKKEDYSKIFEVVVKGKVTAKAVKEELIRQVTTVRKESSFEEHNSFNSYLKKLFGEESQEKIVYGPEDVNTPLYRNGAGYRTEIKNGQIRKLTVHYYYSDC